MILVSIIVISNRDIRLKCIGRNSPILERVVANICLILPRLLSRWSFDNDIATDHVAGANLLWIIPRWLKDLLHRDIFVVCNGHPGGR